MSTNRRGSGILTETLLFSPVGEEIEMTPLLFPKGLVDSGIWAEKYFGRIMTEKVQMGEGYAHKTSRVRVIYGLDPVFDSGINCIIKIHNLIPYGTKQESNLAERNLEITKHVSGGCNSVGFDVNRHVSDWTHLFLTPGMQSPRHDSGIL